VARGQALHSRKMVVGYLIDFGRAASNIQQQSFALNFSGSLSEGTGANLHSQGGLNFYQTEA